MIIWLASYPKSGNTCKWENLFKKEMKELKYLT